MEQELGARGDGKIRLLPTANAVPGSRHRRPPWWRPSFLHGQVLQGEDADQALVAVDQPAAAGLDCRMFFATW